MMKGEITAITSPAANAVLKVGVAHNIAWTTRGTASMGNVDLKFSKTGNPPFTTLTTVAYNSSPYTLWAPANGDITSNAKVAKVRIEQVDNAAEVYKESGTFEVEGFVSLDAPTTDSLKWFIDSSQDLKWTPTGTFTNVKFEYSLDNFSNSTTIATISNTASGVQGTQPWVIPNTAQGDTMKVRVADNADPDVKDVSDFDIIVLPSLTITAPQSGEVWYKGDVNKVISWTTGTSVVTNVKLEYKTSGAGGYTTIVLNDGGHSSAGANNYTWATIPDEKTETAYVKVTDVGHPNDVSDVGDATFSIRPKITVTAPVVDANLLVGTNNATAHRSNPAGERH
jgi:hypothetical protein